jgi:hypothetical protein
MSGAGSWSGIKVLHADGRVGVIKSEYSGFLHLLLTISVDGGSEDHVQLNANGPDTGSPGWQWHCENFSSGARWLPLGDHAAAPAKRNRP